MNRDAIGTGNHDTADSLLHVNASDKYIRWRGFTEPFILLSYFICKDFALIALHLERRIEVF